jgi:hypothetical protein
MEQHERGEGPLTRWPPADRDARRASTRGRPDPRTQSTKARGAAHPALPIGRAGTVYRRASRSTGGRPTSCDRVWPGTFCPTFVSRRVRQSSHAGARAASPPYSPPRSPHTHICGTRANATHPDPPPIPCPPAPARPSPVGTAVPTARRRVYSAALRALRLPLVQGHESGHVASAAGRMHVDGAGRGLPRSWCDVSDSASFS